MQLSQTGWSPERSAQFAALGLPGAIPARVIQQDSQRYHAATFEGPVEARLPKRLRHDAPAVGDFVALEPPSGAGPHTIVATLPRRGFLARAAAGREAAAQPIAANVDVAFIVQGLDGDANPRRLERYQALCASGGVEAVIVYNKADLGSAPPGPGLVVSALTRAGLDALEASVPPGATAVLLGSSGVGKSSLLNALLGEDALSTQPTRDDGRGRHTTTRRQLLLSPRGAVWIDTPGMRELALLPDEAAIRAPFAEIDALAARCRFRDCRHDAEPGCAVRAAIDSGNLDESRLDALHKLQREAAAAARKLDAKSARADARSWGKMARNAMNAKRRRFD